MSYIGNTVENQNYVPAIDYFNGDGSTVAFTLSRPVASVAAVQAVISNVPQNPGSAFTVSGSTITFTSAPPSGTANIYVYYTSPNTQVVQPGQGTVGATQIDGNYALWNKSGSDINYTAGNVGIGTSSPAAKLDVRGVTNSGIGIQFTGGYAATGTLGADNTACWLGQGGTYGSNNSYFVDNSTNNVFIKTNSTERMRIDSSGRVTTPYQPAFRAVRVGGEVPAAYTGDIIFDGTDFNIGSHYNTSNGRFTAPIAGIYSFTSTVLAQGSDSQINITFSINNGENQNVRIYSPDASMSGSVVFYLNANDYVTVKKQYTGRNAYGSGVWTNFSGFFVG